MSGPRVSDCRIGAEPYRPSTCTNCAGFSHCTLPLALLVPWTEAFTEGPATWSGRLPVSPKPLAPCVIAIGSPLCAVRIPVMEKPPAIALCHRSEEHTSELQSLRH